MILTIKNYFLLIFKEAFKMESTSEFEKYIDKSQIAIGYVDFEVSEVRNDSTHHNW